MLKIWYATAIRIIRIIIILVIMIYFSDQFGHVKNCSGYDRYLRVNQQCAGRNSVLSAGMAIFVGPHERGCDIVILFSYSNDSSGVNELFARISNIFCQHNRISQLVYVAP